MSFCYSHSSMLLLQTDGLSNTHQCLNHEILLQLESNQSGGRTIWCLSSSLVIHFLQILIRTKNYSCRNVFVSRSRSTLFLFPLFIINIPWLQVKDMDIGRKASNGCWQLNHCIFSHGGSSLLYTAVLVAALKLSSLGSTPIQKNHG